MLHKLIRNAGAALRQLFVDRRSGRRDGRGNLLAAACEGLRHRHARLIERLGRPLAGGVDFAGDLAADAAQSLAHALAVVGEGFPLARKLVDEVSDAVFILGVGPLQRRDFVMNKRFQFAGAAESARNGVVHRGDLPAHGLP